MSTRDAEPPSAGIPVTAGCFLLTVWPSGPGGACARTASTAIQGELRDLQTGRRHGFSGMDGLAQHLQVALAGLAPPPVRGSEGLPPRQGPCADLRAS